jgi:hypothetical protein
MTKQLFTKDQLEQTALTVFSFVRACDAVLGDIEYDFNEKFTTKNIVIDLVISDYTRPLDCTALVILDRFKKTFVVSKVEEIPSTDGVHIRITRPWS